MKIIELGDSAHEFNKPVLTYVSGLYRFRVRLPMGAAVVDTHPLPGRGARSAITFGTFNGGTVQVVGPSLTIEQIYEEAGEQ